MHNNLCATVFFFVRNTVMNHKRGKRVHHASKFTKCTILLANNKKKKDGEVETKPIPLIDTVQSSPVKRCNPGNHGLSFGSKIGTCVVVVNNSISFVGQFIRFQHSLTR